MSAQEVSAENRAQDRLVGSPGPKQPGGLSGDFEPPALYRGGLPGF